MSSPSLDWLTMVALAPVAAAAAAVTSEVTWAMVMPSAVQMKDAPRMK